MKQITSIRKSVCTMGNELRKEGYSLSQAFRKAWKRVKESMTIRAAGTTFGNIQERLGFMKQFPVETMQAELVRDPENRFDRNAIQIIIHLRAINRNWLCSARTCCRLGSSHGCRCTGQSGITADTGRLQLQRKLRLLTGYQNINV